MAHFTSLLFNPFEVYFFILYKMKYINLQIVIQLHKIID